MVFTVKVFTCAGGEINLSSSSFYSTIYIHIDSNQTLCDFPTQVKHRTHNQFMIKHQMPRQDQQTHTHTYFVKQLQPQIQ